MTRQELLNRLNTMRNSGEDMDAEIVIETSVKVIDKRTRNGYRIKYSFAKLIALYNGYIGIDDTLYAQFVAQELDR